MEYSQNNSNHKSYINIVHFHDRSCSMPLALYIKIIQEHTKNELESQKKLVHACIKLA